MRFLTDLFRRRDDASHDERIRRSSEEYLDIVTDVPHWIIRGGSTVLLLFLVLGLTVAWFLRYPEVVQTQVMLTTAPEPAKLNARVAGRITQVRHEGDRVAAGELIAYVETPTDPFRVLELERRLRTLAGADPRQPGVRAMLIEAGTRDTTYGSLQPDIDTFVRAVQALEASYVIPTAERQIAGLAAQVRESQRLRGTLERQRELMAREVALAERGLETSRELLERQLLPAVERDAAETRLLQQQRNLAALEASLINNEIQIETLEQRIAELELARLADERLVVLGVGSALNDLLSRIDVWKDVHMFRAPHAGIATYHRFRHQSPFVPAGSQVVSVVPDSGAVVGQIELPAREFGKVKVGQPVRIDLDSYPAREFGYVEGRVGGISPLPVDGTFRIDVELAEGLTTPHRPDIEFRHEMTGSGTIVTDDVSLIQRVFFQFRRLWS